jgi:hypothetical protein
MKLLGKRFVLIWMLFVGIIVSASAQTTTGVSVSGRQVYCPLDVIHIGTNFTFTSPTGPGVQAFYIQISTGYQINIERLMLSGDHSSIRTEWDVVEGKLILRSAVGNLMSYERLEAAVRDVVYQSFNAQVSGEKFFSFSMGSASYLPSNGHYYEYIPQIGITWGAARAAAESRTYFGLQGYLVTITAQDEANLVGEQVRGTGWIAASDQGTEGVWRWLSGPESGTVFWEGGPGGSTPNFAFWNPGEPNDLDGEDYAHITAPHIGVPGSWNDLPFEGGMYDYEPKGYVVEYGGMPGDPTLNISGSTSIYIPQIETSFNGEICVSGATTLIAIPSEGTVYWYDQMTGGDILSVGQTFNTPVLTESKTYYATVVVDGCLTVPRTPVEANVNQYPSITTTNDDVICVGS